VLVPGGDLDVVNNVGNELTDDWYGVDRGFGLVDAGQFDAPTEVFGWCGAAVQFPSAYLRDVGGFDERLFLYYEDLDLAWRGRERGWRYRTVPSSVVRHRLGASSRVGSPVFRYHTERNRLVVLAKHAPWGVVARAAVRHLAATASYARRDVVRGWRHPAPALTWLRLRSWFGFVRLLPHAIRERRRQGVRSAERLG
jgi:GT2 family glycosyltransferase